MMHTTRMRILGATAVAVLWLGTLAGAETPSRPEFDHDMTRFPLYGAHERTRCESCHVGARFVGTPTDCAYCHDGTNKWAETAKHPMHPPTAAPCSDCHTSQSWLPARMDHAGVTERCASCHDFGFAEGRPPDHPQSSDACGDCHSTLTWAGAGFDHSGVTGACFGCHNGGEARGKDPDHVSSSNECQLCHSTRRWVPARFDHQNVTGSCSSCHDGNTATGMDSGHFMTSLDCNACHSVRSWDGADYEHVGNYPGDHRSGVGCRDCHTANTETIVWPSPAYQPDCAGCHADDYRQGPHKKHENPDVRYTVSELRDCTGSCHVYTDATLSQIKDRRNGPEHRAGAGDFD